MLSIANFQVSVADTLILRGLSFDVPAGEAQAWGRRALAGVG
jgi:Fe-S cluster assembly ATPase SufC